MGNTFKIGVKHDVTSISSTYPGQSIDNWYFWISILSASLSPHKALRWHCATMIVVANMVADMEVAMVADMEVDMAADMEVDMVADMEVDMVADMLTVLKNEKKRIWGRPNAWNVLSTTL